MGAFDAVKCAQMPGVDAALMPVDISRSHYSKRGYRRTSRQQSAIMILRMAGDERSQHADK